MPIAAGVLMLLGFWAWWPLGLLVLMVLSFWAWWPLGLAVLAFMIGSGRMGCWNHPNGERWEHHLFRWHGKMERMQEKIDRLRERMERARGGGGNGGWGPNRSSGNRAFDDYRAETLRRLEEEQREFKEFLERLRFAKDRAEFDQFMSERSTRFREDGPQPQTT
ncbi:MAG: DUF2852 domain-containing protein [Xanthobacteraceae bacterium]